MSITDELREWARNHTVNCSDNRIALRAIADRIDAEHQKALDEWKAEHGQMWLKGYAECHAELLEGNETLASDLESCGWIRLPKDSDGEVWNVGDFAVGEINPRNPKAIERMVWYGPDSGWQLETNTIIYPCPDRPRHYHAPTVEDVMVEFATDWESAQDGEDKAAVLRDYAKRLTLAEGEDA